MRTSRRLIGWILSVAVILVGAGVTSAQRLSYSSGQSVSPGYEGWEEAEDGQRYFLFGYMNRNWDEEPNIPVGADNRIEPKALIRASQLIFCLDATALCSGFLYQTILMKTMKWYGH